MAVLTVILRNGYAILEYTFGRLPVFFRGGRQS